MRSAFGPGRIVGELPVVRLDDWARETGLERADLIKLDIEGGEAAALAGMRDTLTRLRPRLLLVEVNPSTLRGGHDEGRALQGAGAVWLPALADDPRPRERCERGFHPQRARPALSLNQPPRRRVGPTPHDTEGVQRWQRYAHPTRRPGGAPWSTVAVFSLLPFVVFLNDNRGEAEVDAGIALYALVVFIVGLLAVIGADRLGGATARERAAVVFAVATFVFFHFEIARSLAELAGLQGRGPGSAAEALAAWLILFAAAVAVAIRLSRHAAVWSYMALAGTLLLALPAIQYGYFKAADSDEARTRIAAAPGSVLGPRTESSRADAPSGRLPDIYFFLLDGYGRADQLEAEVDFDNNGFLRSLEHRDFKVHDTATAAYPETLFSLTSTLDMRYPASAGDPYPDDLAPLFDAIEGDNATVRILRELGYRFVFATDYSTFDCSERVDFCIEPPEGSVDSLIGEREFAILDATPLAEALPKLGIRASPLSGYLSPKAVVEQVEEEHATAPVFVYTHILAPHPPYRYNAGCEHKTQPSNPRLIDWGDREGSGGEEYRRAIECVNKSMLAAVDAILAQQRDAWVLVQGDHGARFGIDATRALSRAEIRQAFPILNAQRLPRGCATGTHAELAVNSFRFVLACLTGREPNPLPPRHLARNPTSNRFEEVSEAVPSPTQVRR